MHLTQGIHRAVQLHPDKRALVCGDRVVAGGICRSGRAFGPARFDARWAPGDRVAMLANNSDRYVEFYLQLSGRAACSC